MNRAVSDSGKERKNSKGTDNSLEQSNDPPLIGCNLPTPGEANACGTGKDDCGQKCKTNPTSCLHTSHGRRALPG